MRKPSDEDIIMLSAISRQYPKFKEWLEEWRQAELGTLPYHSPTNVGIGQGRCQVLTEVCKLVTDAPELAAKLRRG